MNDKHDRLLGRVVVLAALLALALVLPAAALADPPQILSISPTSGPPGTQVTIHGANFQPGAKAALYGGGPYLVGAADIPDIWHIALRNNYAYVTGFSAGLRVIDISDPSNPRQVGSCDEAGYGDIAVSGNYAYLADGYLGLRVVDISDPATPRAVAECWMPGRTGKIAVAGSYACVAVDDGLQLVDVSNPLAPRTVGSYTTTENIGDFALTWNLLYVTVSPWSGGTGVLQVIDIRDPAHPVLIGSCSNEPEKWFSGIALAGNFAYVGGDWDDGLRVIDISNPAAPHVVAFCGAGGGVLAAAGRYALADSSGDLTVIDIANPLAPRVTGSRRTPFLDSIALAGNFAYVGGDGLRVIDISPVDPTILGSSDAPEGAQNVAVAGDYAFVAYLSDGGCGLQAIDISSPSHPRIVGTYSAPGWFQDVVLAGNLAYVSGGYFRAIDISDPARLQLRGEELLGYDGDIALGGDYAYVAGVAGVGVVALSDPNGPRQVLSYYSTLAPANSIILVGNYAYVAEGRKYSSGSTWGGLEVIDVSDPAHPHRVCSLATSGLAYGIALAGNYALMGTWDDTAYQTALVVVNISDPANPYVVSSCETDGVATGIAVGGDYAYVATLHPQVIDIGNPVAPYLFDSIWTPSYANGLAVGSNYVCMTDQKSGLEVRAAVTPLENVSRPDSQTLTATVPAGQRPGTWDLHVTNPDGQHVVLHNVFTVTGGGQATCGDGNCNGTETCGTCPGDCGQCPAPMPLSPADGAIVAGKTIGLDWEDVPGADHYEVLMDNNSGFGSPEFKHNPHDPVTASELSLTNWVPQNLYYWKVRAVFSDGSTSEWSDTWQFTYLPPVSTRPIFVPLYRLYNGSCQTDHFYTTSTKQRDIALGKPADCEAGPSYHKFEKVECYVSDRGFPGGIPVMRLNSDTRSCHYYAKDEADKDSKLANPDYGFVYEGIAFYVYLNQVPGSVPLYHLWKDHNNPDDDNYDNFYTISEFEKDHAIKAPPEGFGYQLIDVLGFVMPNDPSMGQNPAGHAGQGVNTENGNFRAYESTDFSLPGRNLSLAFTRVYNSLYSQDAAPLGYGWTHSYNAHLYDRDTTVTVYWGDGSQDVHFKDPATGSYVGGPGVYDRLVKNGANDYVITKKDQTVYTFTRFTSDMAQPARLVSIREKNGNYITCRYDAQEQLYEIVDTVGRSLNLTYDGQHRIIAISDPIGRSVQFSYDPAGNLASSTDARGKTTGYTYSSDPEDAHRLVEIVKPRGNKVAVQYDENHRVASQSVGGSAPMTFAYYELLHSTRISYPATANSPGGNASHGYDDSDRLTLVTDQDNKTAQWAYTDPLNAMRPTSFTNKKGCISGYTYDERGNVLTVTDCESSTWQYTYDDKNNLRTSTDPLGREISYDYDAAGNLIRTTDPMDHQTTMTYTPSGQLETVTNPNSHTTTYTYDGQGNLVRVTDPLGNQTRYGYDAVGRKTSTTDANGRTTAYGYDNNDNLISVQPPSGIPAAYDYDVNDNLEAISFGGTMRFTYNDKDLLDTETDQLLKATHYYYDDLGHLTHKVDANGSTISYYYDPVGRLASIVYPGGATASFTYDPDGNLETVTDQHGTSTYSYDPLNRLITYENTYVNKSVGYEYDRVGNRTKVTYPGGKPVTYTYDPNDRLKSVSDWVGGSTSYSYDPAGNLVSVTNPNGATSTYSYDPVERLTSLANRKPDETIINSYSYVLDGVGNHLQESMTEPLTPTINPPAVAYRYDQGNRLLAAGLATYGYDHNGNLTSKGKEGQLTSYTYDHENRLTQVAIGADSFTYKYDGLGNRIARSENGQETRYVLDLGGSMSQMLAEADASGNISHYYVYGLGLISRIKATDGTRHFYHADSRGSTIAMTDGLGNLTHKYAYDEFGNVAAKAEADPNPFRYVGAYGVMDEGNGLYFMRARYYDPEVGRFITEEPGKEGDTAALTPYLYAENNPARYIDVDGNEAKDSTTELIRNLMSFEKRLGFSLGKQMAGPAPADSFSKTLAGAKGVSIGLTYFTASLKNMHNFGSRYSKIGGSRSGLDKAAYVATIGFQESLAALSNIALDVSYVRQAANTYGYLSGRGEIIPYFTGEDAAFSFFRCFGCQP